MKKFFNLCILAIYEFKFNIKLFATNVVIVSLLFGVVLAMSGMAINIPKEIEREILNGEFGDVQISNIDYKDIPYMKQLPLDIYAVGYDMDWAMFPDDLSQNQKEVNENPDIDNSLNFAYYEEDKECVASEINEILISGERWEPADDEATSHYPMWIDEEFAKHMQIKLGDVVRLENSECSVDFYVKGIYHDPDDSFASSYVSLNLYGKLLCEQERDLSIYAGCATNPFDFIKTLYELENNYYIVNSYTENIYAMFLLLGFIWICAVLLFATTLSVIVDFNNIYFMSRQKFWAVNKALGLDDKGRKIICCALGLIVILTSYIIGVILSKYLLHYFDQYINQLFRFDDLNLDMTALQLVIILFVSMILGCLVLWKKNIHVNEDIKG